MSSWIGKIPSFVWILIILGAIALFIGAVMGGFYAVAYIEGFGSIIMLVAAWVCLRFGANSPEFKDSKAGIAILIFFFALMGIAFDHPGNFIYNQPMELIFCPSGTDLFRETLSRATRSGGVSLTQNFTCVSESGQIFLTIGDWEYTGYRFFQYVLLGYILLYLSRFYTKIKGSVKPSKNKK